uniref:Uncharacterized protein n=1 Tax=Leersia perrieri TaxID=77586 RepID=A0A0D9VBS9_9ORYZ
MLSRSDMHPSASPQLDTTNTTQPTERNLTPKYQTDRRYAGPIAVSSTTTPQQRLLKRRLQQDYDT